MHLSSSNVAAGRQTARKRPTSDLPIRSRCPDRLQLRKRRDDDAHGLYELLNQEDFQRHGRMLDPFTSIEDFQEFIGANGPNNLEIVATIDDAIVGFAGIYVLRGRQVHVGSFTLCVHEGFQRLGVGTVLMTAVVGAGFQLMGLERIQATVFADNDRALSLYDRFGFTIEGRLSRFVRRDDGFMDAYLIARMPVVGRDSVRAWAGF